MKTIYLLRHGEPMRLPGVPDSQWPLTERGHAQAQAFFRQVEYALVAASPCRRALETARHAGVPVVLDARLQERVPGDAAPDMGDCWLRQYEEPQFKCPGGESFQEVGERMAAAIADVQARLTDGQCAVVISHAAAISAYFLRHGRIEVLDRPQKLRRFLWRGEVVCTGCFPPMTGFRLCFEQGVLVSVAASAE